MTSQKKHQTHKDPNWRPEEPINVQETERVEQACIWLLEHRLLNFRQWVKLLNRSEPTVKRFLTKMHRGYYFQRIEMPTIGLGRNPSVYRLGEKGIDLLERLGFEVTGVPSESIQPGTIAHYLGIADTRIATTQGIEKLNWNLIDWKPEQHFDKEKDYVVLPGQRLKRAVQPDGFFVVQLPNKRVSSFFLEYDRATENLTTFKNKVKCYIHYLKSGLYTKRFSYKGFRVLTVVEDLKHRRLENLIREVGKIQGIQRRFWFTHIDTIRDSNPLVDPIWDIAGDETGVSLFDA